MASFQYSGRAGDGAEVKGVLDAATPSAAAELLMQRGITPIRIVAGVVLLDEAQAIPIEALETLRLLSNLETEKRKLIQIVMFGQPELDSHLANPAIRQLRQRIAFAFRLGGMQRDELHQYLTHRLRQAGLVAGELFADDAVRALFAASRGTPRLINILANKCLLMVFGEGGQLVRARHVRAAARDTEGAHRPWVWW